MLNELVLRISDLVAVLFPVECMEPEFMRRAMLGLLLIAPLAALSGVQVVNSRMSFFSDAIGHSAFAGVAIGLILSVPAGLDQQTAVEFSMPALALVIGLLIMYLRRGSRLSTDTVIGIIFSAVVAFGLAIVSRNREAARNANMFLYGDILTIGDNEIALLAVLLAAFLAFQFFAWNRMLHISVNEQIAGVHRIKVAVYQYVFAALLSLVVILCVRAVGVLLVTAILIVPAAAARNFARNSRQLFFLSLLFSYVSCAGGLLISAQQWEWANMPAGAAIVLLACALFAVSFAFARLRPK